MARPKLYNEKELKALEAHITNNFGHFEHVLHEVVSPDIHCDVALINPTPENDFYTLVTMGMGAHSMNVPKELRKENLDRAELMIYLPSNWRFDSEEDQWYWPVRMLKELARFPIYANTWLGWGHTTANEDWEAYDPTTGFSGVVLLSPQSPGERVQISKKDFVNFYILIPLHKAEIEFKLQHGIEALMQKFPEDASLIVDPKRPSTI
ncbi:MAG: suppressor of fused domain protein [Firmicutes bacterium]|nr:suppressor of fused domain protein [Bacillota bacterium]